MATMKPLLRQSSVNNKWVSNCKICRLLITDPEIWVEFHDGFYKDHWRLVDCQQFLNSKCEEINSKRPESDHVKAFSRDNLYRHLRGTPADGTTGHCHDFMACRHQIENGGHKPEFQASSKALVLNPELFAQSEAVLENVQEKLTEFLSLSQMVDSLEKVLAYYDYTLKERMEANETVTIEEVENYQKQVTGLVKLKQDVSKLRNTAKIAGDAVQSTIELTTYAFIDKLLPIAENAKQEFKAEYPNSTLPEEVIGSLLKRLKEEMQKVIPTILNKVLTEYRIK